MNKKVIFILLGVIVMESESKQPKRKRDVDDDYIQNYIQNRNVRPHLEEGFLDVQQNPQDNNDPQDNNEWLFYADYNLLLSMIQDESNALLPNETLESFFARYIPQGLNFTLVELIGDDHNESLDDLEANILQDNLYTRLEREAYEQYRAVLIDERNQVNQNDTLVAFFGRNPVQNPLLPLDIVADNQSLQEMLDNRTCNT